MKFWLVKWIWWKTDAELICLKTLYSKNRIWNSKNDLCRDQYWHMNLVIVAFAAINTLRVKYSNDQTQPNTRADPKSEPRGRFD